jgi:hypothetical protein
MSEKRPDRAAAKDEPAAREMLPLGELPHITDTDPPPLHPDTITGPPEVVDVPHASQEGATLSCTMGNWTNLPTAYAYQWQLDGEDVGGNAATHDVAADDDGKTALCFVTAINDRGETTAPPSNTVVVTGAATRRHGRHGHEDEPAHAGRQEPTGHR